MRLTNSFFLRKVQGMSRCRGKARAEGSVPCSIPAIHRDLGDGTEDRESSLTSSKSLLKSRSSIESVRRGSVRDAINTVQRLFIVFGLAVCVAPHGTAQSIVDSGTSEAAWIISGTDHLAPARPKFENERQGLVLRDASNNRLDVEISPIQDESAWSSFHRTSYSVLMRFTASEVFVNPVAVFMPALESSHFTDQEFRADSEGHLLVTFRSDRVGTDLFLSYLFAPGGLMGAATFGAPSRTIFLRADPRQEGMGMATVQIKKSKHTRTLVRVRSEVEFPVHIEGVGVEGSCVVVLNRTLKPWKQLNVRIPCSASSADQLSIRTFPVRTIPQINP